MLKSLVAKVKQRLSSSNYLVYIKNTSWLFAHKILSLFSTILVGAWVAKYLGPEEFGLLHYCNSIVVLFMPIAMIGLTDIIVKELVKCNDKNSIGEILGTGFILKGIFGLLSAILLFAIILPLQDDFQIRSLLSVFSLLLLFQCFEVFDFYFQSKVKSKFVVYSRTVALVISSTIKILLIYYQAALIYFSAAMVLELLITYLLTLVYFARINFDLNRLKFKYDLAKNFLKRSGPLFLSGMMYLLYIRIDQIMVKEFMGAPAAGLYAVAISLSEAWYFIPTIIASSLFPGIILSKSNDQSVYNKRITNLYSILLWSAVFIALFMNIFSDVFIFTLYGSAYEESAGILNIYIWSNVFFFVNTISSKWLVAGGYYMHSFYRNVIGAAVNIFCNYILIQSYGLQGAAISTLISYSIVGFFYDMFFKELRINFKLKMRAILCMNK